MMRSPAIFISFKSMCASNSKAAPGLLSTFQQNAGLVPIVEPEILLDGDHDINRCLEVAEATWAETFKYLADNKVGFAWFNTGKKVFSSIHLKCLSPVKKRIAAGNNE